MEHLTITRVAVTDKNKEGVEYKDKNGKKFKRVSVLFDKYPDQWHTCLAYNPDDAVMKLEAGYEGSFIREKNGDFLNFRMPSRVDVLDSELQALKARVARLEGGAVEKPHYPTPEEEGIDVANAGSW